MQVILASHSYLAEGLYKSATFFLGKQENLHYLLAYADSTPDFTSALKELLDSFKPEERVVVLCDLKGGSIHQSALLLQKEYGYFLVSGMNLGLVLALLSEAHEDLSNLVDLVDEAKEQLVVTEPTQDALQSASADELLSLKEDSEEL